MFLIHNAHVLLLELQKPENIIILCILSSHFTRIWIIYSPIESTVSSVPPFQKQTPLMASNVEG